MVFCSLPTQSYNRKRRVKTCMFFEKGNEGLEGPKMAIED